MPTIWARQALLPTGWARDVAVEVDETGHITCVTPDTAAGVATVPASSCPRPPMPIPMPSSAPWQG